jgi:hypothetical protein
MLSRKLIFGLSGAAMIAASPYAHAASVRDCVRASFDTDIYYSCSSSPSGECSLRVFSGRAFRITQIGGSGGSYWNLKNINMQGWGKDDDFYVASADFCVAAGI